MIIKIINISILRNAIILVLFFITSSCKKPLANFTWSPKNPKAGEVVQFSNNSIDAKKYDWNLGNMKISKEKEPQNTYSNSGNFIVDLTVRNGGRSDTKTYTITVTP